MRPDIKTTRARRALLDRREFITAAGVSLAAPVVAWPAFAQKGAERTLLKGGAHRRSDGRARHRRSSGSFGDRVAGRQLLLLSLIHI